MTLQSLPQAMLFDLDGTLFKTETLSIPAYHATFRQLKEEGTYQGETPPEQIFLGSLGLLLDEIWRRVLPNESMDVRRRADELLIAHQLRLLKDGLGELYPNVASTLRTLRAQGVRLFVASNGLESYVKEVIREQGISELFEGLYSAGEYQTSSKVDLVRILLEQNDVSHAVMCGDRKSDVEAGVKNQLYTIYCNYAGFNDAGEAEGADVVIHRFDEILNLFSQ